MKLKSHSNQINLFSCVFAIARIVFSIFQQLFSDGLFKLIKNFVMSVQNFAVCLLFS